MHRLSTPDCAGMHEWNRRFFSEPRFAFCAESCVAQGCPLSGTIFVIVTQPVNRGLAAVSGDRGEAGQFAHDCVVLVAHPKGARGSGAVVRSMRPYVSVSIGLGDTAHSREAKFARLADEYRRALTAHIPDWVTTRGEVSGGVARTFGAMWAAPLAKAAHHAEARAATAAAPSLIVPTWRAHGFTALSFVAQLRAPVRHLRLTLLRLVKRLLRMPCNAVPPAVTEDLASMGLLAFPHLGGRRSSQREREEHTAHSQRWRTHSRSSGRSMVKNVYSHTCNMRTLFGPTVGHCRPSPRRPRMSSRDGLWKLPGTFQGWGRRGSGRRTSFGGGSCVAQRRRRLRSCGAGSRRPLSTI